MSRRRAVEVGVCPAWFVGGRVSVCCGEEIGRRQSWGPGRGGNQIVEEESGKEPGS